MLISYVIPTLDRHQRLAETLATIGSLRGEGHDAVSGEVIVVDNASKEPVSAPERLANGMGVRVLRRTSNESASGRNIGAKEARGTWLVMLDDDSVPMDTGFVEALNEAPRDVGAIGAEIFLPGGKHEAGGLPEVFTGCGVAMRRDVFLALGGYDPSFVYYAEEYDLAAKMILSGRRIVQDARFRVLHHKVAEGRDMDAIVRNLVRNNGWVALRYAPDAHRSTALNEAVMRYAEIAGKERAVKGYERGLRELQQTADEQPRRTMTEEQWARFTGLAEARRELGDQRSMVTGKKVCVVGEGKSAWAVRQAVEEVGGRLVPDEDEAQVLVAGSMSPGRAADMAANIRERSGGKPVVRATRVFGEATGVGMAATMIAA